MSKYIKFAVIILAELVAYFFIQVTICIPERGTLCFGGEVMFLIVAAALLLYFTESEARE